MEMEINHASDQRVITPHPEDFDVIGGTYHVCNPSRPYLPIFLQGCEIKSGRVRPGFEANMVVTE